MKIISAQWTPKINLLWIECECGNLFRRRADRWQVRCMCGKVAHLADMREQYVRDFQP